MKKMIAALVLATSFAAFADDAAKTAPPAKSREEDHGEEDHRDQGRPRREAGAGDREGSREEVSRLAALLHVRAGWSGQSPAHPAGTFAVL